MKRSDIGFTCWLKYFQGMVQKAAIIGEWRGIALNKIIAKAITTKWRSDKGKVRWAAWKHSDRLGVFPKHREGLGDNQGDAERHASKALLGIVDDIVREFNANEPERKDDEKDDVDSSSDDSGSLSDDGGLCDVP